jgi:hypothetical protein
MNKHVIGKYIFPLIYTIAFIAGISLIFVGDNYAAKGHYIAGSLICIFSGTYLGFAIYSLYVKK